MTSSMQHQHEHRSRDPRSTARRWGLLATVGLLAWGGVLWLMAGTDVAIASWYASTGAALGTALVSMGLSPRRLARPLTKHHETSTTE
jgi:hypothetical protein